MESFKNFLTESEVEDNVKSTIKKLPLGHQKLLKGFKFKYHGGNVLDDGTDENIGEYDPNIDKITVASPWHYGREFTTLHEIGHIVYEHKMTPKLKKEWIDIVKNTKDKQKQSPEELFCMAYACYYAKHKIKIHDHPEWHNFIKQVPE